MSTDFLCIDAFCLRQFEKSEDPASGFIDCDKDVFLAKVNAYVAEKQAKGEDFLVDGYAPFCKHIFIPNFTSTLPTYVASTCSHHVAYICVSRHIRVLWNSIARPELNRHCSILPCSHGREQVLY